MDGADCLDTSLRRGMVVGLVEGPEEEDRPDLEFFLEAAKGVGGRSKAALSPTGLWFWRDVWLEDLDAVTPMVLLSSTGPLGDISDLSAANRSCNNKTTQ